MNAAVAQLGEHLLWMEIAETPFEQSLGLQGQPNLPEHRGMYFPLAVAIEMKRVSFPIDVVFFRDSRVAKIVGGIPPGHPGRWTFENCSGVLELAGGWAARHGLQIGTPLQILTSLV